MKSSWKLENLVLANIFLVSFLRIRIWGGFDSWWIFRLLTLVIVGILWKRKKLIKYGLDLVDWWVLGFLIINSLSVFEVLDVIMFVKYFEKVVFGVLWFLILRRFKNNKAFIEKLAWVLGISVVARGLLELGLNWDRFADLMLKVLSPSMSLFTKINLMRERTVSSIFVGSLVGVFVYFFNKTDKLRWKIVNVGLILFIGGVIFLSNWRGRFLVFVINVFLSIVVLGAKFNWKKVLKNGALVLVFMLSIFWLADQYRLDKFGYSLLDRFWKPDSAEDIGTIKWRVKAFGDAVAMSKGKLFGVGLGQFYNYTTLKSNMNRVFYDGVYLDDSSEHGPHNLFFQFLAETGYVGLFWLIWGLVYFGWRDVCLMKKGESLNKNLLVVLFWGVVLAVQFDPATSLEFFVLFLGLRGLL